MIIDSVSKFLIKNRFFILIFWSVIIILSSLNLFLTKNKFETGIGEINNSISKDVSEILKKNFSEPFSRDLIITLKSKTKLISNNEIRQYIKFLSNELNNLKEINNTYSIINFSFANLSSKDNKNTLILINLKNKAFSFAESFTPILRNKISKTIKNNNLINEDINVYVTGNAAFSYDMNKMSENEGKKAEQKVLILTIIILILVFRSISAAIIAISSGFFASIITISLLKIITGHFSLAIFCQNISTMIGLALGIDYSLLLITRYRSELEKGLDYYSAIIKTLKTSGVSIIFSGITVLIGFFALFIPNLKLTTSIGIGGVIVVLFSILLSLTFTSLIIYQLKEYINYPYSLSNNNFLNNKKFNEKWAKFIINRRYLAIIFSLGLLIIISLPILNIKLAEPEIRTMPDKMESKKGFKVLQSISKGDAMFPIYFILEVKNGKVTDTENLIKLYNFSNKLKQKDNSKEVISLMSFKKDLDMMGHLLLNNFMSNKDSNIFYNSFIGNNNKQTLVQLFLNKDLLSYQIMDIIKEYRNTYDPNFIIKVGGPPAINYDLKQKLYENFPKIVTTIYIVTFILLCFAFKSILIPIKAIILNTFSIVASYGVLVMVFQYGWGSSLIGVKNSPESIVSAIPVILFCIMFSLSMDYEVFLLSRINEEYLKSKNNDKAVIIGLVETGGVITKAALIMLIVFGAFTLADIIMIKMSGLGLAVAVFIDATIVRMILVPSFMKIAGKANWYFPKLKKNPKR